MDHFHVTRFEEPFVCDRCGQFTRNAVSDFPAGNTELLCFACIERWLKAHPGTCTRGGLPLQETSPDVWTAWSVDLETSAVVTCPHGHLYWVPHKNFAATGIERPIQSALPEQ